MRDNESTLTSPVSQVSRARFLMLAATILWHPDTTRIGHQALCPTTTGVWQIQRFTPEFRAPGAAAGSPLALQVISRQGLQLTLNGDDTVTVSSLQDRMRIEVNGSPLAGPLVLSTDQVRRGVVLGLGGTLILCLHLATRLPLRNEMAELVGVSSAMVGVREQIRQVSTTQVPVLLLAETGSGKEVAAQAIHRLSPFSHGPFVAVNMAALGEHTAGADLFGARRGAYTGAQANRRGFFAEAGQGSLFLDEVGDTPAPVQPMLLRVLESGQYRPLGAPRDEQSQARIIAATDRTLGDGAFNQPLLRRLEAFTVRIPPLRERREDIGLLMMHLMPEPKAEHASRFGWRFLTEMFLNDWPGNVRQLGHAVRRAVLQIQMGEDAHLEPDPASLDMPAFLAPASLTASASQSMEGASAARRIAPSALSDDQVVAALERHGWCVQRAAQALSISRPSLYGLINRSGSIRDPADVPEPELRAACFEGEGRPRALEACATALKVPKQALRRHLRSIGLLEIPSVASAQRE